MNPPRTNPDSIQVFETLDDLYQAAADAFCDCVDRTLQTKSTFKLSLSGGSTPKRLYELLAQRDLPWQAIHWFWGDERNVAADHDDSNAKMVRAAILDRVGVPSANVHPVPVIVDAPSATAVKYEQTLREHFPGDEFPHWDLALLGMGDDAHTASLFPTTAALDEHERWFVENWVEKFNAYRYTLTPPAINSAAQSWFLVAGEGKRKALANVLSPTHQPHDYPSQLIQPTAWFVTRDAMP